MVLIHALAVLTLAPALAAQEQPASARGPWVLGAFGPSYIAGDYEWAGPANPGYGVTGELSFDDGAQGPGGSLLGALGYRIDTFGVGLGADISVASTGQAQLSETNLDAVLATTLSLVGVLRARGGGAFGAIWLGGARYAFAYGKNDSGSADNVVEPEPLFGPSFAVGGGYLWDGIGVFGRVTHARLTSEHATFNPWLVTAGAVFTSL